MLVPPNDRSQDDALVTNPEELQRHFDGHSRTAWWVIAGVAVLALVASAFLARPAWRVVKRVRAASFAKSARDSLAQKNPGLALQHARAALQLQPHHPDYLRLNARLLTEMGSEMSLGFWQRLVALPTPSIDDQLDFLESALVFRRPRLVGLTFSNLCVSSPPSARLQRLGALYHLASGASNAALACARIAHQLEPSNPTNALLLVNLIPKTMDSVTQAESRSLLREVAQSSGPLRMVALHRLVQSDLGERADREWVAKSLSEIPKRSPAEEALLAETQIRLDPATTRVTLSNLVSLVSHNDPEMLTAVVESLARLGQHEEVLNLTSGERGFLNRQLFTARFDALSALHLNTEAYQHLLTPGAPMPPFELALAKIKASVDAKDITRRDAHFEELLGTCGNHGDRLRAVADLAEKLGSHEVAAKAWKQFGALPGQAAAAERGLQRVADRRGDTWSARDHARNALRAGSSIATLPLEIAYYDILLGENIETALAQAQAYAAKNPRDYFPQATIALAHLRLGEPEKARLTLDRLLPDETRPRADAMAVLAATCGQNGFGVRAREIASRIPIDRLRPEERELIRPWVAPPPADELRVPQRLP